MPALPSTIALTSIADGSLMVAADPRNNFTSVQTAVNALIAALAITAKGDLLAASASGVLTNVPVGANGTALIADSTQAGGVKWAAPSAAMTQICDLTLGGSQASFDTNTILGGNIPAIYNHLKLVLLLREDDAVTLTNALLRFNNDSGANYNLSNVQGNNNVAAASQNVGGTSHNDILSVGASGSASKFGTTEILIPAYAQTTAQKTHIGTTHADASDTAANLMTRSISGTWKNTAAVTRIQVLPNGGNFVAGSRFTLYGLI